MENLLSSVSFILFTCSRLDFICKRGSQFSQPESSNWSTLLTKEHSMHARRFRRSFGILSIDAVMLTLTRRYLLPKIQTVHTTAFEIFSLFIVVELLHFKIVDILCPHHQPAFYLLFTALKPQSTFAPQSTLSTRVISNSRTIRMPQLVDRILLLH